jgi:hypothetical protein
MAAKKTRLLQSTPLAATEGEYSGGVMHILTPV